MYQYSKHQWHEMDLRCIIHPSFIHLVHCISLCITNIHKLPPSLECGSRQDIQIYMFLCRHHEIDTDNGLVTFDTPLWQLHERYSSSNQYPLGGSTVQTQTNHMQWYHPRSTLRDLFSSWHIFPAVCLRLWTIHPAHGYDIVPSDP